MAASATWPLSADLLASLTVEEEDGRLVSLMRAGPSQIRVLDNAPVERLAGSLLLTGAELALLRGWGRTSLNRWSLSFSHTDPATGILEEYVFLRPPRYLMAAGGSTADGRVWSVAVELERQ